MTSTFESKYFTIMPELQCIHKIIVWQLYCYYNDVTIKFDQILLQNYDFATVLPLHEKPLSMR